MRSIIAVPVRDSFGSTFETSADTLFRIADRDGSDRTQEGRIPKDRSEFFGRVLAAPRQPCGRESAGRDGELNILDHGSIVSKICSTQIVGTSASANIELGCSGTYQITVGVERA